MATGYRVVSGPTNYSQLVSPLNTQELGWTAPAGGMYSSPNDMAAFFQRLFRASAAPPAAAAAAAAADGPEQLGELDAEDVAAYLAGGWTNMDGVSGLVLVLVLVLVPVLSRSRHEA
jgi:hypothetical protein